MNLRQRIQEDMKAAMRARETVRLAAVRLLLAAIKQREVDERIELDDAQVVAVIEKMLKQRRESIAQYEAAGRDDLAQAERAEAEVLQVYLPVPFTAAEIAALIESAMTACGAAGPRDMGKVMAHLRPMIVGRADGAQVSAMVRDRLAAIG